MAQPVYRTGLILIAALLAVITTHLIGFAVDHPEPGWLNASASSSWSHRAVAVSLAAATVACAWGARGGNERGTWVLAALILGFLALDELTSLHAHVDEATWGKVLYAPILLALGLSLWRLAAGTNQRGILAAALITLAVSFVIHVFGAHVVEALGWGTGSWPYQVKVALKEGMELAGWLLVLTVLLRLSTTAASPRRRS